MDPPPIDLKWSAQLSVTPASRTPRLSGDKILLSPAALEQLLAAAPTTAAVAATPHPYTSQFDPYNPYSYAAERLARQQFVDQQQQLPHPLTFRIVNPDNGRVVYAGIREFSARDEQVGLSNFLRNALGVDIGPDGLGSATPELADLTDDQAEAASSLPRVTVHAKQLPKGTYVRLRPLEAGYDFEDWKSLLERYLRDNFTTLTNGEILTVPGGGGERFQFLIDKFAPEGDGICIVDTDLEVDIEALNEEQARETLKRKLAKSQRTPGTKEGSSPGGKLKQGDVVEGRVAPGEYVDYELHDWDRQKGLEVEIEVADDTEIDLFVSPFSSYQRSRPRDDEHVFGEFASGPSKRIRLSSSDSELEHAESVYISIHAYHDPSTSDYSKSTAQYILRIASFTGPASPQVEEYIPGVEETMCKNCHQYIPQRTLFLHENFCLRNNIFCADCSAVFQKRSPEWANHWHCLLDSTHGNTAASKTKHDSIFHPSPPPTCPCCSDRFISLPALARHRTSTCPSKIILCQFCHLLVPQQSDTDPSLSDPAVLISGLTPHELTDGARTTECHLCSKIIRLRDMRTHLRHHDLERLSRPKPHLCRNANCGRTVPAASPSAAEQLGLCTTCFGPLYVAVYDPDHRALKRRIERRYLTQMLTGCGKAWCQNHFCRTGRKNSGVEGSEKTLTAKDALALIKPLADCSITGTEAMFFCVDEASQKRRAIAGFMAAELPDAPAVSETRNGADGAKSYDLEWIVAALEAERSDIGKAREWLRDRAPRTGEVATA